MSTQTPISKFTKTISDEAAKVQAAVTELSKNIADLLRAITEAGPVLEADYMESLRNTPLGALLGGAPSHGLSSQGAAHLKSGDLAKPKKGKAATSTAVAAKRVRRSPDEIAKMVQDVHAEIANAGKDGIGRGALAEKLHIDPLDVGRCAKALVDAKAVKMKGSKRAAVYITK